MFQLFLITALLILIAVAGLCLRILLVKGGQFPDTHIESNAAMKTMGIKCAKNDSELCQGLPDKNTKHGNRSKKCNGNPEMEETCALCGSFFKNNEKAAK